MIDLGIIGEKLHFVKRVTKPRLRKHLIFTLDKRQRFAIQTLILTTGILCTQLIWEDYRFVMVGILASVSYILSAWSLSEDIQGIEWLLLFILPVLFTASVSLFYFLLPGRWIIRLTITVVFAVGMYAALLVENIYNVAVFRSIQLLRAAQSVGLLITLAVVFLSTTILFSIRVPYWMNVLILSPVIFMLALQSLWSSRLDTVLSKQLIVYSAIVAVGVGEMAGVLSFWPVQLSTASLFITACYYTLVGITQQYFLERLFNNTIKEYIYAFFFSLLVLLITTKWG